MGVTKNYGRETVARAARIYRANHDASKALGISVPTLRDYCEKFEIETPIARRIRLREARRG